MKEGAVIQGPYLADLLEQPTAVRQTLEALKISSLAVPGQCGPIILTGMGSSFHALHPLALRLIAGRRTPLVVETSELIHAQRGLLRAASLVVAVSQSGQSAEIVRLLEINRHRALLIGVTNTPDSPLARRAGTVLLTKAGQEYSVSCKTYVATLAALAWLAEILLGRDPRRVLRELRAAPKLMATYLGGWRAHARSLSRALLGMESLFLLGRGSSVAAAGTGSLIIKEAAHFHAEGMNAAAFRHGPFEMVSPETLALVYEGSARASELNRRLVHDVRRAGGRAVIVGENGRGALGLPVAGQAVRPLLEILPAQMVTLALAALASREAGRFEHASKITVTE